MKNFHTIARNSVQNPGAINNQMANALVDIRIFGREGTPLSHKSQSLYGFDQVQIPAQGILGGILPDLLKALFKIFSAVGLIMT